MIEPGVQVASASAPLYVGVQRHPDAGSIAVAGAARTFDPFPRTDGMRRLHLELPPKTARVKTFNRNG